MTKPAIGFIGLGLMGSAMCQRLLDLGYPLTVIANRTRTNVEKAIARGAIEAKTSRGLAERSDVVMLCVSPLCSSQFFEQHPFIAVLLVFVLLKAIR